MADSKIDPFDVAALEKSLNDSATRVSTIWVSFLIFGLYLLTAVTTVTHRQLFLAEPLKLPVLNIDLPLWGFFFLAPILFVILHAYVLIQVILLARTAAAYNEAVKRVAKRDGLSNEANASLRQRLANTLFAQIFAGSPREREGGFGKILHFMAWITLAMGPLLILLAFQFAFLPFHSHVATWTHRSLVFAELAAIFLLWPLALDAARELRWSGIKRRIAHAVRFLLWLLSPWDTQRVQWRPKLVPIVLCVLCVLLSLFVATFPGEPHLNVATGYKWNSVQCTRWFAHRFDRLVLPQMDFVDDDKFAKIEKAVSERGRYLSLGEATRDFRKRDLSCGNFDNTDLRRADFTDARLIGAQMQYADLKGVSFDRAQLREALLSNAKVEGATFYATQLQATSLIRSQLQGTAFFSAQLQGAILDEAQLQGADIEDTYFDGASLYRAQLQGASVENSYFRGASLKGIRLQGAILERVQLQGALLDDAFLQGVILKESPMTLAYLSDVHVWRAKGAECKNALVREHRAEAIIDIQQKEGQEDERISTTLDDVSKFIERSIELIPDLRTKKETRERMHAALALDPPKHDTEEIDKVWSECEEAARTTAISEFDARLAEFFRKLVCNADQSSAPLGNGIVRIWINDDDLDFSTLLARGLLGEDGNNSCAATRSLNEATKARLKAVMAKAEADNPSSDPDSFKPSGP
jgi:uncharacterized protein YjbI with pentapeptide repeats